MGEEYLEDFHWIVTLGIGCGLDHLIEWAVNAWRTPGGSLGLEYYERMRHSIPRFLAELYESCPRKRPGTLEEVLSWCDEHYEQGHMCRGFFRGVPLVWEEAFPKKADSPT